MFKLDFVLEYLWCFSHHRWKQSGVLENVQREQVQVNAFGILLGRYSRERIVGERVYLVLHGARRPPGTQAEVDYFTAFRLL